MKSLYKYYPSLLFIDLHYRKKKQRNIFIFKICKGFKLVQNKIQCIYQNLNTTYVLIRRSADVGSKPNYQRPLG